MVLYLRLDHVVVGRKCLAFEYYFPSLLRRLVEACHQEVEIGCESLHDCHFCGLRTDYGGHIVGQIVINVQPWYKIAVADPCEVTKDAFRRPDVKVLLKVLSSEGGLQAKGITTEIDAWVIVVRPDSDALVFPDRPPSQIAFRGYSKHVAETLRGVFASGIHVCEGGI